MTPADQIADLNASLALDGETVILRRGAAAPFTDLTVRAHVRHVRPEEIVGGIVAGDSRVILSPTGLDQSAWVNAAGNAGTAPFIADQRIPKVGDTVIAQGRSRRVQFSMPIMAGGVLVRIELLVRG